MSGSKEPICSGFWVNYKNQCDCLYCWNNAKAWRRWINAQENVARLTVAEAPQERLDAAVREREIASHDLLRAGRGHLI